MHRGRDTLWLRGKRRPQQALPLPSALPQICSSGIEKGFVAPGTVGTCFFAQLRPLACSLFALFWRVTVFALDMYLDQESHKAEEMFLIFAAYRDLSHHEPQHQSLFRLHHAR